MKYILTAILLSITITTFSQPTLLDENLSIKKLTNSPSRSVRLSYNQQDGFLYLVTQDGDLYKIDLESGVKEIVQTGFDLNLGDVQGMDISKDGTVYLVGNFKENSLNTVTILRGTQDNETWSWEIVAETEPYPLSNTAFDHIMNNVTISPDGNYLILNSGSRTDHGEVHDVDGQFPDLRETALTAKILRIPADTTNLVLENNLEFLRSNNFIYAEGTRNSFSLAFDKDGNLFGTENAGDRDDPEEINWLQEGKHYGFPWVIGGNQTPMQFGDYNPDTDSFIPPNSTASNLGTFRNDPDYPSPPEGITFTSGLINHGPDADTFRDPIDGLIKDASDLGVPITSFSSHLSPLGLVFDTTSSLNTYYQNDGFMLGFTGGNDANFFLNRLNYHGEDLMHLNFTKNDSTFEIETTSIIKDFYNPIDSEIIGNKIYIVEFKTSWLNRDIETGIWEVTFPKNATNSETELEITSSFKLHQNYPNPFNPTTNISFELSKPGFVELLITDSMGRNITSLVNRQLVSGTFNETFNAENLASGIYFYSLFVNNQLLSTQKMTLIK